MDDITKRFIKIYNFLRQEKIVKNDAEMARLLSVTPSAISNIIKGTSNAQIKIVQGVAQSFTMVNIVWLLTGEGEMQKRQSKKNSLNIQNDTKSNDKIEVDAQGIMSLLEIIRDEQKELISSLKKIQAPSSLSEARRQDEPHTSDVEEEVEKVRAKIASGEMGVRNAPAKRKVSEKK